MSRAKPKLVKFPGPMDGQGERNVALLARRVKNNQVSNVLCMYEMVDGRVLWFRSNLSMGTAALRVLQMQNQLLTEAAQ